MAAIQTQVPPSSALTPGSTVVRTIPSVGFKVDGIEAVAGKVNGAAQYIFKVEFNPNPNAPVGSPKFTAEIPLHASSMEKALAMLHVYAAEVVKTKNHAEFHEVMQKLKYSAVIFDSIPGNEDYKVSFSEYDTTTRTFKESHINSIVRGSVHENLKQYAEILESEHQDLFPRPAVHPQVSLQQTTAPIDIDIRLTPPSQSLSREWEGHKEKMKHYFGEVTLVPIPAPEEHKAWMEFLDKKVFNSGDRFTKIAERPGEIAVVTKALCDEVRQEIARYRAGLTFADTPTTGNDAEAFSQLVDYYINRPVPVAIPASPAAVSVTPAPAVVATPTSPEFECCKSIIEDLIRQGGQTFDKAQLELTKPFLDGLFGRGFIDTVAANSLNDPNLLATSLCDRVRAIIEEYQRENSAVTYDPIPEGDDVEVFSQLVAYYINNHTPPVATTPV